MGVDGGVEVRGGTPALTRAASYRDRLVVFVEVKMDVGVGSESICILRGGPNRE